MTASISIEPLGERALLVQFDNVIDEKINTVVHNLFFKLKRVNHPAIKDIVPAYASLAVHYNVFFGDDYVQVFSELKSLVESLMKDTQNEQVEQNRLVKVPVCYDEEFAIDLEEICSKKNLSPADVVQLHTSQSYRVYMIGFLPGFPYMGQVDSRLQMERKQQPRQNVIAGSVGIAGLQTGIYPLNSPGGWQIIGRTPLKIFDASTESPVFFEPGDEVVFYSISKDEFTNIESGHT